MAQEVQTSLNYKAELNLIEGVGHQEGKVREHTQVEQAFGYECYATGRVSVYVAHGPGEDPAHTGTMSLDSQNGITEFKMVDGGLRIPLAGAYLAEIGTKGGSTNFVMHMFLKVGDKTLWSRDQQVNSFETTTMILNLGKYDIIKFRTGLTFLATGTGGASAEWRLRLRKL